MMCLLVRVPTDTELLFCALVLFIFNVHFGRCAHGGVTGKEIRLWQPKYPPVIWYPEYPMFQNRTSSTRIVVQMHDSLDFFCPDYLNSQYQSFTGAKKRPTDYGAEEIYMVNGEDYQQCLQDDPKERRLNKKHTKLLLRCPNKITASDHHTIRPNNNIKAKYQYTVSFRMFSPMPKGPEFNCNHEYYFLGVFTDPRSHHKANEERTEALFCSPSTLRLQIFVSCNDESTAGPSTDNAASVSSPSISLIQTTNLAPPGEGPVETIAMPFKIPLWSLPQSSQWQPRSATAVTNHYPSEILLPRLHDLRPQRVLNISRSDTRISQSNLPANHRERSPLNKTGVSRHKHLRPTHAVTSRPSQPTTIGKPKSLPLVDPAELEVYVELQQAPLIVTTKTPAPVFSVPHTSKPRKNPSDRRGLQKNASISLSARLGCSWSFLLITVLLLTCWF